METSIWERKVTINEPYDIIQTGPTLYAGGVLSSGSVIGGGMVQSGNTYRIWLIKLTPDGCLDTLFACTPTSETQSVAPQRAGVLTIFPNPAYGPVQVLFPESEHRACFTVLDATGYVLFRQIINMSAGSYSIEVSDYPPGLYYTLMEREDGNRWMGKLVVMRE